MPEIKTKIKKNYLTQEELPASLRVQDVAAFLNISLPKAYALVKSKDFPKITNGSMSIIPKDHFLAWVNAQTSGEMDVSVKKKSEFKVLFEKEATNQMMLTQKLIIELVKQQQVLQEMIEKLD